MRKYLSLLPEEPFRMFFPLAVVSGMIAVALWPLYFWSILKVYPNTIHASLMIESMIGGFLVGFIGTAGPRLMSASQLRIPSLCILLSLYAGCFFFHLISWHAWGDACFLALLSMLLFYFTVWMISGQDIPPPCFALLILGLLSGIGGSFLLVFYGVYISIVHLPLTLDVTGKLLLFQGFPLCSILGVAPFFFPKFGDLPNRHSFPETRTPTDAWHRKARLAAIVGVIILTSLILEGGGMVVPGRILRFFIVCLYVCIEVPFRFGRGSSGTLARCLQAGIISVLSGTLWAVFYSPSVRMGLDHLILIGGLGLIVPTVAARVLLGHSGNGHRLRMRSIPVWLFLFFIIVGLVSRVSSEFMPTLKVPHYIYAAEAWLAAMAIWALVFIPLVLIPDPDP